MARCREVNSPPRQCRDSDPAAIPQAGLPVEVRRRPVGGNRKSVLFDFIRAYTRHDKKYHHRLDVQPLVRIGRGVSDLRHSRASGRGPRGERLSSRGLQRNRDGSGFNACVMVGTGFASMLKVVRRGIARSRARRTESKHQEWCPVASNRTPENKSQQDRIIWDLTSAAIHRTSLSEGGETLRRSGMKGGASSVAHCNGNSPQPVSLTRETGEWFT